MRSSQAIGKYVVELVKNTGLNMIENPDFNPYREPIIVKKSEDFDGDINATDPNKHIICRCEKVTEAELIDALGRGIDVNSIDSMKRRTRAGMGACQGRFCGPRVAEVIAKTMHMSVEDVPKRGQGSSILPPREDRTFWRN